MANAKVNTLSLSGLDVNAEVGSVGYIGDLPRAKEKMAGVVRRLFLTQTTDGKPMLKVLYETTQTKYQGYTAWDNVTLTNESAFKWKPLLAALGVTAQDLVSKGISADDANASDIGSPVVSIAGAKVPDGGFPVFYGVSYRTYQGESQTDVAGVLPRATTVDGPF